MLFEQCTFRDNALIEETAQLSEEWIPLVFEGNGISLRDCEIEKSNFLDYWRDIGVIDLDGNELI